MNRRKDPNTHEPERAWARGPSIASPAHELVAWLDANAGKLTRVPLVLQRGEYVFSSRGARIGAVEVDVGDAALGISITMRARKSNSPTAAFIAQGFWRGARDGRLYYELRAASMSPIDDAALAAQTHLEVAGD